MPSSVGRAHSTAPAFSANRQRSSIDVEPDDAHASGDQQPDHELADETETDDAGGIAELGLGAADALHGDGPDSGEGGVLG